MKSYPAILACCAALCGCQRATEPAVSGHIDSLQGKIYLHIYEQRDPILVDSAQIIAGKFAFGYAPGEPILASIDMPDGTQVVKFFCGDGPVHVTGRPDSVAVSGSKTEELYHGYLQRKDSITEAMPGGKALEAAKDSLARAFVAANPHSMAAAYVFYREGSWMLSPRQMLDQLARFDTTLLRSTYLESVRTTAEFLKKTDVGEPYTDVTLPDVNGRPVALSSLVDGTGYVLLHFWASWCSDCRAEAPVLVEIFNKHKSEGLRIYAVAFDRTARAWEAGREKLEFNGWTNVSELQGWSSSAGDLYGIKYIPSNVLISPQGVIVARSFDPKALDEFLARNPRPGK